MIEPHRNDVCNELPRGTGCCCPISSQHYNHVKYARQLLDATQSSGLIASLRKYEREDGVVNWAALHSAFQLSCLTH